MLIQPLLLSMNAFEKHLLFDLLKLSRTLSNAAL